MRIAVVVTLAALSVLGAFLVGFFIGETRSHTASNAQIELGIELQGKLMRSFGDIHPADPHYKDIVETIHIVKDMDIAVIHVNGVKTIRVYR